MNLHEIEKYFDEYIFGFICSDIENCILAKANYVVALALLSYTEYLGGLKSGNLGVQGKSRENFQEGLSLMELNGDFGYYKDFRVSMTENGRTEPCDVYCLFRCGMVHEYFVKGKSFVHNNSDDVQHRIKGDAGIGWISDADRQILRFHTNAYFRDFRNALNRYLEQLKGDEEWQRNFTRAITRLNSRQISVFESPSTPMIEQL